MVERSKPGTYSYGIVVALYGVAIYTDRASLFAAAIAVTLLMLVGAARAWSYRVPSFRNDLSRWRWSFCVGAFSCMLIFDSFVAFELWHRAFDPAAMVILAASLAIRASVANVLAPDRWVSQVFARFSRPPVFIACIAMWSPVSLVLLVLLLVHTIYLEMSGNQLNAAYWRGIAASEAVERANASLRAEVVMRERAEIELRLAQKLESVGRLAAGIAHEMNSPLQAMVNSVHFAEEATNDLLVIAQRIRDKGTLDAKSAADVDYLGANLPDAMAILRESLERTASIVKSVKTFAQPSATERSPVDLNKAVATTLDISRHEYAEFADVKLELGELPMVQCFAGELNQALLNIVINAAQAIEDRGATQRGLITVRTESTGGDVRIAISDTGGGIPSEIRDRIFDPFFTTKPIGKGTGQGLAIARSVITTRHGGELSFTSEVGRGTTFVIQLPARA
ncbi:MAG TPA: ATP-binding protein [Kofleriaceae bacterium]